MVWKREQGLKVIAIMGLLAFMMGCRETPMKKTKFNWLASDSGPEGFPMQIIKGDFELVDGSSLFIPDRRVLFGGWGMGDSTYVVGADYKALPTHVSVRFYSYTEDAFYQGRFALPYDEILAYFQAGFYSLKGQRQETYRKINLGVAPGGEVAVWLQGADKITQVFFGQADKVDLPWSALSKTDESGRLDYINNIIEETTNEAQRDYLKHYGVPLGLWSRYQRRYHWQPRFITPNRVPKLMNSIEYFNGEMDYFFYPLSTEIAEQTRAVPVTFRYTWMPPYGEPALHEVFLESNEIIPLFEQLHAQAPATANNPIWLNITIDEAPDERQVLLSLQHGETVLPLKQAKVHQYISNASLDKKDYFYQDKEK
ncbi:DUF2931 family protein [Aliikangiella maris]|uniref:DUF2931 family protein n=1 Tax=Aliikangiella maris TaxID=3162458 RepID=A0ABV3MLP4_9GAMM